MWHHVYFNKQNKSNRLSKNQRWSQILEGSTAVARGQRAAGSRRGDARESDSRVEKSGGLPPCGGSNVNPVALSSYALAYVALSGTWTPLSAWNWNEANRESETQANQTDDSDSLWLRTFEPACATEGRAMRSLLTSGACENHCPCVLRRATGDHRRQRERDREWEERQRVRGETGETGETEETEETGETG